MKRLFLALVGVAVMAACSTTSQLSDEEQKAYDFADELIKKMTLREKIGQLQQFTTRTAAITGPDGVKRDTEECIRNGEVGSFLSIRKSEEMLRLQKIAVEESRLGIPLIFGYDIIHGCRITFPENLAMSCSWDIDAIEHSARIAAIETAATGIHWTFSPMCDISADPRWGRVSEGAGEDPYLGAAISAATVRGYQGNDLAADNTIAACVKHFAAYGAGQAGRDYHTVDMSEMMFRDRFLPPYRSAVEAGAVTAMSSFNDFMGVPASGNKWLLHTLLREELGFTGFVVSDYNAVHEMVKHGTAADGKEAACQAMNAHLNMDMVYGDYIKYGEELVKEGKVSEKTINQLCREVLAVKYRLGLFEDPFKYGRQNQEEVMYRAENLQFAREVAAKSMVLLSNNGVLPLKEGVKIALVGPLADAPRDQLGAWIGWGEAGRSVTIRKGLEERFGAKNIIYAKGSDFRAPIKGGIEEALRAARKADVVLLAIGLSYKESGEATSLTEITVPEAQQALLDALKKMGKRVVVLLGTGRAMDLRNEIEKADAVLLTWHGGTMEGAAVADLVSGDKNPSGHLTMSFPYCVGQVPVHYNNKITGRPRKGPEHDKKYLSRYMYTPNEPLFTFGYGLSYTEFDYSDLQVLTPEVALDGVVKVSVKVKNVGKRDGEDVAQLYVRDLVAETTRPMRELKGFERIALKAGEERVLEFEIPTSELAYCHQDLSFHTDKGEFLVGVGADSNVELTGKFTIK
ncbi:MAG: glycoside hydrolase family 3 C-terminal domain-containing protein [Alistipes sp.]|nr:glycoside hydrolase family 3 C-terminal domain-containing protein [Alistipes sp.]